MNSSEPVQAELATFLALILFMVISLGLGVVANYVGRVQSGFLKSYFLGNRSLGAFAVALTAAVMSGGTFLGFPSLVYKYGWVVGLWICSYMVVPVTVLGVLGKRIGQLARRTGAITLPDFFRERFASPLLGLITSILVILFLSCNLVAQFKGGGLILKLVLPQSVHAMLGTAEPGKSAADKMSAVAAAASDEATTKAAATAEKPKYRANTWEDRAYVLGLVVFSITVIFYTAYGGFLAAIWTDVFQSLVMALGVMILFPLAMNAAGGINAGTLAGISQTGDDSYAYGPGAVRAFHPIGLAVSFFVMWAISAMGQPSTLVRLMAFRDTRTLRWSIIYLTIYNLLIYVPLIMIFVCARQILPNLAKSDEVMPRLVITLANPYIAGLIIAAPFGAVMSTVSGWLLIISSGIVRDLYQRFYRPQATEKEIERASYLGTVLVGVIVCLIALNPPEYLQLIVVFSSSGMAASFLAPAAYGAFWRRANGVGMIAAMLTGAGVTLGLYALGMFLASTGFDSGIGAGGALAPYYLLGLDPCVWGISSSFLAGAVVSLKTKSPSEELVERMFGLDTPPLSKG
jgi:SSS family solute:Na+ symporter/sodium/pantothenate symporter